MKFINGLATVLKFEVFFLIFPKLLTKFGTKVIFLNSRQNGVTSDLNILIDFLKENKELSKMDSILSGLTFPQGSHKG